MSVAAIEFAYVGSFTSRLNGLVHEDVDVFECRECYALVRVERTRRHDDWHQRAQRSVDG